MLIMHYEAFISVSLFSYNKSHHTLSNCILRLQPRGNFFDILLVFVFFLQTYYDICFFQIFSFHFYLLQISFVIYHLLALLIFLYRFHNNLLPYLVSHLCFFDNKFSHSFFIHNNKNYKTPILSIKLELFIKLIASSLLIYQK